MSKTKVDKQRSFRYDLGDGLWYDALPDQNGVKSIDKIEELYNCRYVCEWNTTDSSGRISTYPMLIFWNDVAHPLGSNWMALFKDGGHNGWFVRDGIAASRVPILAGVSNNGQAMFSKNRHDYRQSHDGSITLDGGRDYTRIIGTPPKRWVWLLPQDGEIRIIDESAATLLRSAFDKKQAMA